MRRRTFAAAAALTIAGSIGAVAPAASGADCTTPQLRVLERVGGNPWGNTVHDLGPGGLAVGESGVEAAYWIGTKGYVVPTANRPGTDSLTSSTITAVNKHGLMTGWRMVESTVTPFTYRVGDKRVRPLPVPGTDPFNPPAAMATDINDSGVISGYDSPRGKSYLWRNGKVLRELPAPAGVTQTQATALNNAGTVVGTGLVPGDGTTPAKSVIIVWSADRPPKVLGPVLSTDQAVWTAPDIDEHGRIVSTREAVYPHTVSAGVYWDGPYSADGTEVRDPGYESTAFTRISPTTGLIAGWGRTGTGPSTAISWSGSGPLRTLPSLNAAYPAGAGSASDDGTVAGWSNPLDGESDAVLWTCAAV